MKKASDYPVQEKDLSESGRYRSSRLLLPIIPLFLVIFVYCGGGGGGGENSGTITREVPHSEETMKEVVDNETRNPPTDNILRVAPYHKSLPPVELPPFPNLPHPPEQE